MSNKHIEDIHKLKMSEVIHHDWEINLKDDTGVIERFLNFKIEHWFEGKTEHYVINKVILFTDSLAWFGNIYMSATNENKFIEQLEKLVKQANDLTGAQFDLYME